MSHESRSQTACHSCTICSGKICFHGLLDGTRVHLFLRIKRDRCDVVGNSSVLSNLHILEQRRRLLSLRNKNWILPRKTISFPGTIVTLFFHDRRTMTSYNLKPISRNRKSNFLFPRWNIVVAQFDYKTINYFTGIIWRKLKVRLTGVWLKWKLGGNKVTLSYAGRLTLIYDLNLIAQNCSSSWNNWNFCTNWF